jgi:DNA-directed RNA polymerase subunit RPC12/RpoP
LLASESKAASYLDMGKVYACPHCASTFTNTGSKNRHVRTVHEKRRDHACPQCDYKTGQAGTLRVHVRVVHEKRMDHACPQCDYKTGHASNLRTHVRLVHEKRRDYACPHCDFKAAQAGGLRVHLVSASGVGKCAGDARQQQIAKRNEEQAKHDELKAQTAKEKAEEKAARAARAAQEKAARDNVKDATGIARRICRSGEPFQGTFDLAPIKADELMEVFHCAVGKDFFTNHAFFDSNGERPLDTAGEQLLTANATADDTHDECMESLQRIAALFGYQLQVRDLDDRPVAICEHAFGISLRLKELLKHHKAG